MFGYNFGRKFVVIVFSMVTNRLSSGVCLSNDKIKHPFYRLLSEIDLCLSNGIFMPALGMALTIPDICGQIFYPKCKVTKFYYTAWYDEFQFHYDLHSLDKNVYSEHDKHLKSLHEAYDGFCNLGKKKQLCPSEKALIWPYEASCGNSVIGMSGAMAYSLRCSFLHNGNMADLDCDKRYSFDFTFGETIVDNRPALVDLIEEVSIDDIRCHVNINRFCKCLVRNGLGFFLANFDRFSNMQFSVMSFAGKLYELGCNPVGGTLHRLICICDEDNDE